MHVILKLIGHIITEEDSKYFYEIRLNNINIISFDIMKTLLISYGIEDEDIQNITITCDCKNIKNDSIISSYIDEEKKIYIYTCKDKVRSQLEEIFITYGHKTLLQPANQNKALFDDLNSQNDFEREMEAFKKYLVDLNHNKAMQLMSNTDLYNIRDEILGDINQLLYLLSFK